MSSTRGRARITDSFHPKDEEVAGMAIRRADDLAPRIFGAKTSEKYWRVRYDSHTYRNTIFSWHNARNLAIEFLQDIYHNTPEIWGSDEKCAREIKRRLRYLSALHPEFATIEPSGKLVEPKGLFIQGLYVNAKTT